MPRFHKAIQDIAIKASVNGGPTIQDVLTALCASHEDSLEAAKLLAEDVTQNREHNEVAHKEIVAKIDEETAATRDVVTQVMDAHMEWTQGSGGPLARLTLVEKVAARRAPRRMDDPSDSEFTETRESAFPQGDQRTIFEMILGFSVIKWLLTLVVAAIVVWGVSYWASSCAAQRAEENFIHDGGEIHLPAANPSP